MGANAPTTWEPILSDNLYDQAVQTVIDLGSQLESLPLATSPEESEPGFRLAGSPGLSGGSAGAFIGLSYLSKAAPWYRLKTDPDQFLEHAVDRVGEMMLGPDLYSGFTGVAWALAHVGGAAVAEAGLDAEIDTFLCDLLEAGPWGGEWELIRGLAGIGVYALERVNRPEGKRLLSLVIDHLGKASVETPEGITWWTSPQWMTETQRRFYPNGGYNLGVSHGVPGVIGLLAMILNSEAASPKARRLLDGSVRWLLMQHNPNPNPFLFSTMTGPGVKPAFSRLAWCYGDAGIAAVLMLAARATGEARWEQLAVDIARNAAAIPFDQTGVVDAGFCHGSAGLGHLFNRLYQASGDPVLKQAACHWFDLTLKMRKPGNGTFGYMAWESADVDGKARFTDEPGLLTGATGIMAALLGAVSTVEPKWDRMFVMDIPLSRKSQQLSLSVADGGLLS